MLEPTVYASLMDRGVKQPLADWNTTCAEQVSKILSMLEDTGLNQIRAAYTAGVQDGYRQALMELEKNDPRKSSREFSRDSDSKPRSAAPEDSRKSVPK